MIALQELADEGSATNTFRYVNYDRSAFVALITMHRPSIDTLNAFVLYDATN